MASSAGKGFIAMPVKFSAESKSVHFMFLKEHSIRERDEEKPRGRTLFVVSVPPYCNEASLKRLFSEFGTIADFWLQKTPSAGKPDAQKSKLFATEDSAGGFKVSYVVFEEEEAVQKALSMCVSEPRVLSPEKECMLVGLRKWCDEYKASFLNIVELQNEIDAYMEDYDKRLEEEKKRAKEMEGIPDEEGWIKVTKYGKKPVTPRTDAFAKKVRVAEKKKRSQKELLNFYTFQIRQSKMEHIAQLRKKFEEDKRRIAIMKSSRRFKPV